MAAYIDCTFEYCTEGTGSGPEKELVAFHLQAGIFNHCIFRGLDTCAYALEDADTFNVKSNGYTEGALYS